MMGTRGVRLVIPIGHTLIYIPNNHGVYYGQRRFLSEFYPAKHSFDAQTGLGYSYYTVNKTTPTKYQSKKPHPLKMSTKTAP